jgi:fatty aldehyde-generating acyl-ACP reductase
MKKFAFLVHPRKQIGEDLSLFLRQPIFNHIPDTSLEWALHKLPIPPLESGTIHIPINGSLEHGTHGTIITVPLSARQMLNLPPRFVRAKINQAIDHARNIGCEIVGLGALTAPVTLGGKTLTDRTDIAITNGNAFTAAMTFKAIERLLNQIPTHPHITLVGATGSVGSCLTRLIAKYLQPGSLTLIARNTARLEKLQLEIQPRIRASTSTDLDEVFKADLIVLLTSSPDTLIGPQHLKPGAVILDNTQPRNTHPRLLEQRPDVTLIDGGLVDVPHMTYRGSVGLPPGMLFACMAETALLSLEGHSQHFSIGEPTFAQAVQTLVMAEKYREVGFTLSKFHAFGKPLETARANRNQARGTGVPVLQA